MERTRRSHCNFPRLDIAYIWENASWYCEGYKSQVTERTSICECGVVIVFLLLIEEKCPGRKMDPQGYRHIHRIG